MATDGWATRGHLLDVGGAVLRERGVDFSLREVARRAGVSPAAVYRHFANRDALLAALTRIGSQALWMRLLGAASAKTPRARLVAATRAYLTFGVERPADYRASFMTPGAAPDEASLHLLADRVRECMGAGVLVRGDSDGVARALWAHAHGLVSLRICGQLRAEGFEELFDRSVDRFLGTFEVNSVHNVRGRRSRSRPRRGRRPRS